MRPNKLLCQRKVVGVAGCQNKSIRGRGDGDGKTDFFSKFFQIRLAIVQKEMYIRKSSVILELNASVDPAKLIRKLWKIFQSWLEKLFEVWYIMQPTLLGSLLQKRKSWKKIKNFEKVLKILKIQLDKCEKLWYIKKPSNATVEKLIENWIVRCEPWNSLENSNWVSWKNHKS